MKKKIMLFVVLAVLAAACLPVAAGVSATPATNTGVAFNSTSAVVISKSGFAVITDGVAVTGWFDLNTVIKTADGGQVVILQEVRNGKKIGPVGWRYEGAGTRSGVFEAANVYLPSFTKESSVAINNKNQVAIIVDGARVSPWVPMDQKFLTSEGGEITILKEVKDGKVIGPKGWLYEGDWVDSGPFGFTK